jgi:cold shock CspA family protein
VNRSNTGRRWMRSSCCLASLEENQRVQFEVGQGAKGPQAIGVSAV